MKSQGKKLATKTKIPSKVFVGLSGGVDSAVSAALLKEQGFDVIGVFIKAWTPPGFICTWKEDRRSAMRAAAVLNIPFLTLDLEKEYKRDVVDYMLAEYKIGRTPNPDVMCNKEIKFGHFLKFALENGADFVATGHYAQVRYLDRKDYLKKFPGLPSAVGETYLDSFSVQMLEGIDKNKDQSYFLWTLTQDQLKHILFPIGHLEKQEVRKIAEKFSLPQATRKDSQGLCFLGKIDMKDFLSQYINPKKGNVLDIEGKVIGWHDGAFLFTLGERHGFSISKNKSAEPFYVVDKDISANTITVDIKNRSKDNFSKKNLIIKDVNWISEKSLEINKNYFIKVRYRDEKRSCKISVSNNKAEIVFSGKAPVVSPGQSVVIYDGEICLGGGIISQ